MNARSRAATLFNQLTTIGEPWKDELDRLESVIKALDCDEVKEAFAKRGPPYNPQYVHHKYHRSEIDGRFSISGLHPTVFSWDGSDEDETITNGMFEVSFGKIKSFRYRIVPQGHSEETFANGVCISNVFITTHNAKEEHFDDRPFFQFRIFYHPVEYKRNQTFFIREGDNVTKFKSPAEQLLRELRSHFGEKAYNRLIAPLVNGDGLRTNSTPTAAGRLAL